MTPLLFLALLLADTAKPSPAFDRIARQAASARDQNRLDDALGLYRQAVKLRPNWAEGWWFLGTILYDRDQYPEARDALRRFVPLDARDARGPALLGLCEYHTGEYDSSLRHLNAARRLGLRDNASIETVVLYHAALLLTRFEQYESALSILMDFARRNNESPSVIEAAGLAALRKPLLPPELPESAGPLVFATGRAVFLTAQRKPAEARKAFEDLLAAYPAEPNLHYLYGSFLLVDDPSSGLGEFEKELAISPAHLPSLVVLALEYQKRGDPAKGRVYAQQAVEAAPNSFAARTALGKLLLDLDDAPGAIRELETALRLAPDSPQVRIALASAYAKAGRKDDAARQRAEFLKLKKIAEAAGEQ